MSKKIARKNLPSRLPVFQTIVVWVACDHFETNDIWIGVIIVLMSIIWIACVYGMVTQDTVDIFGLSGKDKAIINDSLNKTKKDFQAKMQEMMDKAENNKK